jgi:aerobic-type carbon monoxide dehydrogenase small subunit (CoxS/CutS family)
MVPTLNVNRVQYSADIEPEPETLLLWVLRDTLGLTRHEIRLRTCRMT